MNTNVISGKWLLSRKCSRIKSLETEIIFKAGTSDVIKPDRGRNYYTKQQVIIFIIFFSKFTAVATGNFSMRDSTCSQ
jgi:hypothetical protein